MPASSACGSRRNSEPRSAATDQGPGSFPGPFFPCSPPPPKAGLDCQSSPAGKNFSPAVPIARGLYRILNGFSQATCATATMQFLPQVLAHVGQVVSKKQTSFVSFPRAFDFSNIRSCQRGTSLRGPSNILAGESPPSRTAQHGVWRAAATRRRSPNPRTRPTTA
jgi:hypothetical protein